MSDLKISALPRKSALAINDLIPIVDIQFGTQNYVNKKTTIGDIVTIVSNAVADLTGTITSVNGLTGDVVINAANLGDTTIVSPAQGDILRYDATTNKWVNIPFIVDGKIPAEYLPSYVDDVVEYPAFSFFPEEGESGKIYVDVSTGYTFRWSGTVYVQIGNIDHDVAWESITGVPTAFNPAAHTHTGGEITINCGVTDLFNEDDTVTTAFQSVETTLAVKAAKLHNADHLLGGSDAFPSGAIAQAQIASDFGNDNISGDINETREMAKNASNLNSGTVADTLLSENIARSNQLFSTNVTTTEFTVKAVSQGVYADGTTVAAGTSLETIIKNMLQVRVPAVYAQPTLTISTENTLAYEYGSNISVTTSLNWTKNDAGNAVAFRYKKNGTTVQTISGSSPASFSQSFTLNAATTITGEADYGTGAQKYDNFGDASGSPISAGTKTTANSVVFTPLHKRYWGLSANATLTDAEIRALNSELATNRVQTRNDFNPVNQYIYIAYPASFGLATIKFNGYIATSSWPLTTRDFTNAQGYAESYHIYRTQYTQNSPDIDIEVL